MKHDTGHLIGAGGMGEVYRAWDADLERHVALKYLRHADGEMVERLLREARAQARIDHPGVCKVYEVGEEDGLPFIAMEFVEGRLLDKAAESMTLERKVLVVKLVAEAVQAAHTEGLIHRDLKPSNIMVAEGPGGEPHPYVLDFGIAREQSFSGLTATGQVLGTPGYLSPEQARGEGAIDRRTDIFSLGVILYELCSGGRPFAGDSDVEVLVNLLAEEAAPLRQLAPGLPRDLETIVMRCLEKDPERRYPSARGLADDLGRFLAGEPVTARPITVTERLFRRVRKHPGTAVLAILSLAAILVLSGIAVHTLWTASQREEVAQRFGQEVAHISSAMRIAHLTPLHDLSSERAFVESRLEWIRAEMRRLGAKANGPGHYALGRGHLELGRPAKARDDLEAAWAAGYQSPEAAHALGEAYGALYLVELELAQRTRNTEQREERVAKIQEEFREPALRFLAAGAGAQQRSPDYVQAQIAFYEERFDDAIVAARTAAERYTWLYEARVLEGRALYQKGMVHLWNGRYQEARDAYDTARDVIVSATEIGRSDPITHEALCINWHLVLEADRAEGRPIEHAYHRILETCGRALLADPLRATAHEKIARAHWRWGEVLLSRGEDPITTFEGVVAAARAAVAADPSCFRASNIEGLAWWRRAKHEYRSGIDPRESLEHGAAALELTLEINPNYRHAHNNLGLIYSDKGTYELSIALDPSRSFERSIAGFNGAIEVDPEYIYAYNNLGVLLLYQGRAEVAIWGDAEPLFERAAASARLGLERNPRYANAHNTLAQSLLGRAEHRLEKGLAIAPLLEGADRALDNAVEINPLVSDYHATRAHCRFVAALEVLTHGGDPTPNLETALAALDDGFAINPELAGGKLQAGGISALAAEHEARNGRDPTLLSAEARRLFREATALKPDDNAALVGAARVALLEARYLRSRNIDPSAVLDSAQDSVDRAAVGRYHVAPLLITARIHLERARWQVSRGRSPTPELEAAEAAAADASELVPEHPEAALLQAELVLSRIALSGEQDDEALASLDRALETVAGARAKRPSHLRTLAVQAALILERARRAEVEPDSREAALRDLNDLMDSDALLKSEFGCHSVDF